MKRTILLAISIILLACLGPAAQAQFQQSDYKQSLQGLNGVFLVIQIVDEQPEGIATNSIETLVKTSLTDAGIPVQAEPQKANGDANLSIVIDTIKQPQLGIYAFTVEVSLTQDVRLSRLPHADGISAETWRKTLQGITSPDRMDVIQLALKQALKYFVTDYRAVNPPASGK